MASSTEVDVAGMRSAAGSINAKASDLKTFETSVQQSIQVLMGSWKGTSALAFNQAMEQFYAQCNSIILTLQQLSESVNTSATNYQAQHEQNDEIATSFANSVPTGLKGF